jgi:hypothetical protein
MNKENKYHRKKNQNPSMYKKLKHTEQKEKRKAYVLSNAFEVAKKLFGFIIRVLMLIGVFNG